MTLLNPLGILGLLGIAVPLLLFLIRPKYRPMQITSTYIWRLSQRYASNFRLSRRLIRCLLLLCQILAVALLRAAGYDADVKSARETPPNISGMCKYGMVMINADVMDMPANIGMAFSEYVSKYERSVLVTGGENTYAYGHMHETPFEEFLPVTMMVEDKESAEPVAMLLLIDNSASMAETTTNLASDQGPIEMAKLGAIKSINLLHDNDYAGVISFSTQAHLLCELRPAMDRDEIIATVSRMGTISGTMYTEALKEAVKQFAAFDGYARRRIIFLSDGNPMDEDYMPVVEQLRGYGMGMAACFMSDLSGAWSAQWLEQQAGRDAILEIVDALMPEGQEYAAVNVEMECGGREAVLRVRLDDAVEGQRCEASVKAPGGTEQTVHLLRTVPGVFEKAIALDGFGMYAITLRQYDESGALMETGETACAFSRSREYEAFPEDEAQQRLAVLCALTGGQVFQDVDALLEAPLEDLTADVDPSFLLALLMMLAFLAELILRHRPAGGSVGNRK